MGDGKDRERLAGEGEAPRPAHSPKERRSPFGSSLLEPPVPGGVSPGLGMEMVPFPPPGWPGGARGAWLTSAPGPAASDARDALGSVFPNPGLGID